MMIVCVVCFECVVDVLWICVGVDDGVCVCVEGEMDFARTACVGSRARSVCGVVVLGSLIVMLV